MTSPDSPMLGGLGDADVRRKEMSVTDDAGQELAVEKNRAPPANVSKRTHLAGIPTPKAS